MSSARRLVQTPQWRRAMVVLAVLVAAGLVLAGTGSGFGFLGVKGAAGPDLILVNGAIVTMDEHHPRARAIAITDDEITAVGSSRAVARLAGPDTRTIDLRGRTVI